MKRIKIDATRTIRIIVSLWLGIWMLCFPNGQYVSAEGTLQIGVDQYEITEDGDILIYVNQSGDIGFTPTIDESFMLVGKNTLQVEEIKSLSEAGEPISYICLVDISGSMTEEGIRHTKNVLTQFVEDKDGQDNFCITTMGNDVQSSGFLTDPAEIAQAIDDIERIGTEDTNLYYSITEAINVLKTDSAVHKKRCLIIFSDGEDDQKKGITEKEAEDAVKENHIPIFTVVLPGSNLKDAEGSAKILGSFARNSAGGEHYAPLLDDSYEYSDICNSVNTRLRTSLVARASLDNVKEIGNDTVYISVELSDGVKKDGDGMTVPAGRILEAIEAIEEAQKGTEVTVTVINENANDEEEEAEESLEETEDLNKLIVIGIALLAIVLVLIVILIMVRKNAKREPEGEEYDDSVIIPDVSSIPGTYSSYDTGTTLSMGAASNEAVPETPVKNPNKEKVQVTLFKVGPGEVESHKLIVKDKATIGRNKSCQLAIDNDSALSGIHCSILYHDGKVFVKDEESTNGTYVNGVPIVGEFKVEQDDILMAGSSEFRIVWE